MTVFRHQLQQDLDELGRFESLPWGLPDPAAHVIRALRGGRSLTKSIRAIDTIRNNGFASVRSRMERWIGELESSASAAREESIVFYLERDDRRTLKAYHTRNLRLQQAVAAVA